MCQGSDLALVPVKPVPTVKTINTNFKHIDVSLYTFVEETFTALNERRWGTTTNLLAQAGHKGPAYDGPADEDPAHKGLAHPGQGGHEGLAQKGPGEPMRARPTRARPTSAQGGPGPSPQGPGPWEPGT